MASLSSIIRRIVIILTHERLQGASMGGWGRRVVDAVAVLLRFTGERLRVADCFEVDDGDREVV